MKDEFNEVNIIFEKINREESSSRGKVVAIEVESGDYFIGDSELDAYRKAIKKHPGKQFFFKRIGFRHIHSLVYERQL